MFVIETKSNFQIHQNQLTDMRSSISQESILTINMVLTNFTKNQQQSQTKHKQPEVG